MAVLISTNYCRQLAGFRLIQRTGPLPVLIRIPVVNKQLKSNYYFLQQINTTDTQITIHNLDKTALYHLFVVSQNDHGTSLPSSILVINITKMGKLI